MLADLIHAFCNDPENNYEVLENYSASTLFGEAVTTLAIVVEPDRNFFDVLAQLTSYIGEKLEAKEIDESILDELEGANVDYTDDSDNAKALIYFPFIKDYP